MERKDKKMNKKIEDLPVSSVVILLEQWEMEEFVDFIREKQIDGRKLMNITEGILKLWRPKSNANKLVVFVSDLKSNPENYLKCLNNYYEDNKIEISNVDENIGTAGKENSTITTTDFESQASIKAIECQYQTVKKTKDNNLAGFRNVEELIKKIVPEKSFLYRNQEKKDTPSYLPMNAGTQKKKKLFRISGYDYPNLNLRRFSKQDLGDRGYYPMQRNSRFFIQKSKPPDSRPKYKSLSSTEELKYPEDHFYEDLCYNEVEKEERHSVPTENVKPYKIKIQELFQSFKMPFFKRNEEMIQEDKRPEVSIREEEEKNLYENSDSIVNMYDSVHVNTQVDKCNKPNEKPKLLVEEYLEPVQLTKDYCDITYQKPKDESLLGYIMSIFENRFGIRRETNESANIEDSEDEKQTEDVRTWNTDQNTSMADRPLPVPVENEPYYMNIDRTEAENLLKGQLDGTFVLRPSSQSNHVYTVSVSCNNGVHNVGVRRRADGRLALGFARRGERTFADVASLLRHHKKRRLLLVANGSVIGATTLNESPQYYQTPCNIPVKVRL